MIGKGKLYALGLGITGVAVFAVMKNRAPAAGTITLAPADMGGGGGGGVMPLGTPGTARNPTSGTDHYNQHYIIPPGGGSIPPPPPPLGGAAPPPPRRVA